MYTILFALMFSAQSGEPRPDPDQPKVSPKAAYSTVQNMRVGGYGWIDQKAIAIDNDGYCWIRRDAQVKSSGLKAGVWIRVDRDAKGYGVKLYADYEWEITPRAELEARLVAPAMRWEVLLPDMPVEKVDPKKSAKEDK